MSNIYCKKCANPKNQCLCNDNFKAYTLNDLISDKIAQDLFNKSVMDKDDIRRIVLKVLKEFNNGKV